MRAEKALLLLMSVLLPPQFAQAKAPRPPVGWHALLAAAQAPQQVARPGTDNGSAPSGPSAASRPSVVSGGGPNLPPTNPTVLKTLPATNTIPPLPAPLPALVSDRTAPLAGAPQLRQAPSPPVARAGPPTTSPTGLAAGTINGAQPPKVTSLPPGPLTSSPIGIAMSPNELRITGPGSSSAPWGIVLLLTLLTLIPSLLICVTPFARLLIVFHFLRQALGLQTTPSNQTLIGLTLILTFFIMEPVGKQVYENAFQPLERGAITPFEAVARAEEPMRDFMGHFVREKDAALFLEIAKEPRPRNIHDLSMRVLLPAYIVSELKSGFQIGAVLFLPFLVVDMVVASITTSVGMMQLPPVVISTPLKLMLFLMVDGWHLLIGALVRSFQ